MKFLIVGFRVPEFSSYRASFVFAKSIRHVEILNTGMLESLGKHCLSMSSRCV